MGSIEDKTQAIRSCFAPVLGAKLDRYETAEFLHGVGTWDAWPDLPIRLHIGTSGLVAVSWSQFDELWLARDSSLQFSVEGSSVRWVENANEEINAALGGTLLSVLLGRGQLEIAGRDVEVWTRLLIQVDDCWLEVFNALDENGYAFHRRMPPGEFVPCA